jgi:hypothetical protein
MKVERMQELFESSIQRRQPGSFLFPLGIQFGEAVLNIR